MKDEMKKEIKLIMMLCLIFSAAFGRAYNVAMEKNGNENDIPIVVIGSIMHGGPDRSTSIQATINGQSLTVVFTENLGNVQVEVTDSTGGTVDYWDIWTPNGYIVYIYDLQGRLRDARPFDFSTTINAGGWHSGVYLWEIWRDDQKLGCGKWVKN